MPGNPLLDPSTYLNPIMKSNLVKDLEHLVSINLVQVTVRGRRAQRYIQFLFVGHCCIGGGFGLWKLG